MARTAENGPRGDDVKKAKNGWAKFELESGALGGVSRLRLEGVPSV